MLESVWKKGWSARLNPAPIKPTVNTPAVDVRPTPEIHIFAPANRLDRPRSFTAKPLNAARLAGLTQFTANTMVAPLAGFDIDAGMSEDERFAGPVSLGFDLKRLNIPENLWPHLLIARVDEDGTLQPHNTRVENGEAVCEIRHNSAFTLFLLPILGIKALYVIDQYSKGTLSDNMDDFVDPYFRIFWPRSMGSRNTPEVQALSDNLAERWSYYYYKVMLVPQGTDTLSIRTKAYMQDPAVKKAYETFHNLEWRKKYYYPYKVVHCVDALEKAGKYLYDVRKLRKRGEKIEVYLLDPWTYNEKEVYAYSKDGHFTYPYIHVNLEKVPEVEVPTSPEEIAKLDNLKITLVHELFHVTQKEYYNWSKYMNPGQVWGGGVNHWFVEATALVLEEEARTYYLNAKWNQTFPLTADNLYASQTASPGISISRKKLRAYFKIPIDASGSETEAAHRGYAASQFLLDLRDRYYSRNLDKFLPAVLEAFGTFNSGAVDALVKATSDNEMIFRADYLLFCSRNAVDIADEYPPQTPELKLTPTAPKYEWKLVGPVSSPCAIFRFRELSEADSSRIKVVVRTNGEQDEGIFLRRREGADYRQITQRTVVLNRPDLGGNKLPQVELQRVETNVREPDVDSHGYLRQSTLLLLAPPQDAPKVTFDDKAQAMHVELPETPLYKLGEVQEFWVKVVRPNGRMPLIFRFDGRPYGNIAWRQIAGDDTGAPSGLTDMLGPFTPLEIQDMLDIAAYFRAKQGEKPRIQISYLEVVRNPLGGYSNDGPGIDGPESQVFDVSVPVDGFPLAGAKYDISGTWTGKVWIFRQPLVLNLVQSGSKLSGTYVFMSDTLRLEGEWDAKEDGWKIRPFARVGDPIFIELYLRALPGKKLWLGAPPCVLTRPSDQQEKKGGWFGWW